MKIHRLVVPTPFSPVGPVNAYLLEGDPLTLVDGGPKTPASLEGLEAGLRLIGHRLADISQIIITHAHCDHYGLVSTIREASAANVVASHLETNAVGTYSLEWGAYLPCVRPLLMQLGLPNEQYQRCLAAMSAADVLAEPVHVDRTVNDGDVVRAGGADWLVMHTPGHVSGHICLYQPEEHVLLSGDHLLGEISSNPILDLPDPEGVRTRSLQRYIASLRRTADLDVSIVWPGHGDPILDHRKLIEERLRFHGKRKEHIYGLLADGPRTPYQVSAQLFPALDVLNVFLAISEVVGHLDLLEVDGAVSTELRDDMIYYSQA